MLVGLVPGMPTFIFLILAAILAAAAWYARTRNAAATDETEVAKLPEIATPVQTRIGDVLDTDELC